MKKIDSIDNKIIDMFFDDGRVSASLIAERIGLSVPATTDRIKKLQDSGVIKGFRPILDGKKIGLDITAFITVYSESSKNFEKVVSNATKNPSVMKCYTTTGDGSHLLLVQVGNTNSLEKLLRTVQGWPGVTRTQTQMVLSSYIQKGSSTLIKK